MVFVVLGSVAIMLLALLRVLTITNLDWALSWRRSERVTPLVKRAA